MTHYKKLDNGIRLIVKDMTGLASVSMGILVGVGAAAENDTENGLSHFIEHVMFKGTERYTAAELSYEMDMIGAQMNAFTGKDATCYYVKSTTDHAERAFEILCDMFLNSTFPEEELEREKGVIHEEISMTEDTPDDLVQDIVAEAYYGTRGYGRNILGTHESVSSFTKKDIESYMDRHYAPGNIVISMAGNIDINLAEEMTEKYFSSFPARKTVQEDVIPERKGLSLVRRKDIEQMHIALSYPSLSRGDELYDASLILNSVLGGSMSSRLFQTVREKMGLAYSIYSYLSPFAECGTLNIYAGVNSSTYLKALDAIYACVADLRRKNITEEEFLRGKEQMLSSNVFSQESTSSQMLLYGRELMSRGKVFDFDEQLRKIKAITINDVFEATDRNFGDGLAAALVGDTDEPLPLQ